MSSSATRRLTIKPHGPDNSNRGGLDFCRRLDFFTSNKSKVDEARLFLSPLGYSVVWRRADLVESQARTLGEVVKVKLASAPLDAGLAMVEDSGFFVHTLNGFPGVYSSYVFKTIGCDGILRLLGNLRRDAHFEAVVGIRRRHETKLFKGMVKGRIPAQPRGSEGFGFDPIFIPEGSTLTMAELPRAEKVKISHRTRALESLAEWLRNRP